MNLPSALMTWALGWGILSLPSDTHDAIALNHNLNITNRRAAVAVDQHAAVNDHDGRLKRLREGVVKPRREGEEHRCNQNESFENSPHPISRFPAFRKTRDASFARTKI